MWAYSVSAGCFFSRLSSEALVSIRLSTSPSIFGFCWNNLDSFQFLQTFQKIPVISTTQL
jgi:hypothetical protein